MANFGDFKPTFDYIISLLKGIDRSTSCTACAAGGSVTNLSAAGTNISVPAGFKSIAIVKTGVSDTVDIEMSDSSLYTMTELGEVFVQAVSPGSTLPAYNIAGESSWKWQGIQ